MPDMTIEHVRRQNAQTLAAEVGGVVPFSIKMGLSKQYGYRIAGASADKGIGHAVARRIEEVFGMPSGWMDVDHANGSKASPSESTVEVRSLDVMSAIGLGASPPDSDQTITSMCLSKNWIRHNTQATSFEALALTTAQGDGMSPTFGDGSTLLLDRSASSIKADGIYVLLLNDELFIKRVQRRPGGVTLISDNPMYQPFEVDDDKRSSLRVLGRVLLSWNPKKL